jgi:hypothetical protein
LSSIKVIGFPQNDQNDNSLAFATAWPRADNEGQTR